MCRLYGFISNEPTKVGCTLVRSQNALMLQSRSDEFGRSHSDGWGIGYYDNFQPKLVHRTAAAYQCLHFSHTAERLYSNIIISHVRLATIGKPAIENCHPFRWGNWIFAHNGTVQGMGTLRAELTDELSSEHREAIRGSTDSELIFHWVMQRLSVGRAANTVVCKSLERSMEIVGESLASLESRCREITSTRPARLNILLSDGNVMIATRLGNSLSWTHRDGIRDCEICGIPHVHHNLGSAYRATLLASEPMTHEIWEEVPDRSVFAIDRNLQSRLISIP